MDAFYRSIYSEIFINWVLSNIDKFKKDGFNCLISKQTEYETTFTFEGLKYSGRVSVWDHDIVEQVIMSEDEELLFYLHFNLLEMKTFQHLFYEFYNNLIKLNNTQDIKIAFCCTGGLSTSLFVSELLEVCKLQKIDYQLYSISIDLLFDQIENFDAIYLAPQISHLLPKMLLKTKIPIYCIDATVFATKNYQQILKTIKDNLINSLQS